MKLNINYLLNTAPQMALSYGEKLISIIQKNKIVIVALLALGCLAAYLYKRINHQQPAQLAAKTHQPIDTDRTEANISAKTQNVFEQAIRQDEKRLEGESVADQGDQVESKEPLLILPSPPPSSSPLPSPKEKEVEILDEKESLPYPSPVFTPSKDGDEEKGHPQEVKMPENLKQDDYCVPQEYRRYLAELKAYLEADCCSTPSEITIQGNVIFGLYQSPDELQEVFLLLERRAEAGGSIILHCDILRPQMQSSKHPEFSVPSWATRLVAENCECKLDCSKASSLRSLEIVYLTHGLNLSDADQLEDVVIYFYNRINTDKIILSPSLKKFTLYTYQYSMVFEKSDLPFFEPIDFTPAYSLEFLKLGAYHNNITYKIPPTVTEIQMCPFEFPGNREKVISTYSVTVDASDCQGLSQESVANLVSAELMEAKIIFPCSPEEYQKRLELARLQKEEKDHTLIVGDGDFYREDLDLSQFTCLGNEPVWNLKLCGGLGHPKKHIQIKVPSTLKVLKGGAILNADLDFSQAINLTTLEFFEIREGNTLKIPSFVTDLTIQQIKGTLDLSDATGLSQDTIEKLRTISLQGNGTIIG